MNLHVGKLWHRQLLRWIDRRGLLAAAVVGLLALATPNDAESRIFRDLPQTFKKYPFSIMSLTVGHPNAGWQTRAKKLRDTDFLEVRDRTEHLAYGHPALVLMLRRSAREIARDYAGSVMFVGDLSSEHGGPIFGHRSHQSGRDADVAFFVNDAKGRPVKLNRFVRFGADGVATDGSGRRFDDARNWLLVQSWVRDERAGLSHVFVSSALRQRLLDYGRRHPVYKKYVAKVSKLLKQPANAGAHDNHFHVRISCPQRQRGLCRDESLFGKR